LAPDEALSYNILLLWDPFLRSRARFNRYFEDYIAPSAVLDYKKSIANLQRELCGSYKDVARHSSKIVVSGSDADLTS
jgi:hypothetical protein